MWIDQPDDEEQTNQPNSLDSPSVGAGGGSVEVQPSAGTTGNPSTLNPAPQGPTQQAATIQDYFKGNRDQGEALGSKFTSKLDETKQQSEGQIGQATAGALSDVEANTVGFDQGLVSKAAIDPTKVAGDEAEFDKFMGQWNAAYKGPDSFESTSHYDTAAKAAQTAQDKATQVGSTGGRQQMIQDEFGVYGAGNKGLDEAILQQSSYFPTVGEKATELNSLQDYLKTQSGNVASKAQEAKATTEQTKQQTQEALLGDQGAVKQFKTDVDTRTAQAQEKAKQDIQSLQKAVESKADLTDEQLKMLGTTRQEYKDLIQKSGAIVNPQSLQAYLTAQNPAAKISRETVAGSQDVAKDQALAKLTGGSQLLGASQTQGKLVDFNKDQALQDYLNSINADKATREEAERQRIADQQAADAEQDATRTAKREDTQNTLVGNVMMPGIDLVAPGLSSVVGGKVSEIIDKDKTASKVVDTVNKAVVAPVSNVINNISKSISKAFCFDGETLVDMVDGSKMPIKDIKLGDRVKDGGVVLSTRQSITSPGTRYGYKGVIVTGSHAVREKHWLRVKDSIHAHPIDGAGIVYSLVTSLHKIYIKGIQFADEHETDKYESLSLNESLAELNRMNRIVLEVR